MEVSKTEALELVEKDGMQLRILDSDFQNDVDVVLAAIKNNANAFQFASDRLKEDKTLNAMIVKNDSYYFDIVNPQSGLKYAIPMLNSGAPGYFYKYINYMKLRERSPETFQKVLNWD